MLCGWAMSSSGSQNVMQMAVVLMLPRVGKVGLLGCQHGNMSQGLDLKLQHT